MRGTSVHQCDFLSTCAHRSQIINLIAYDRMIPFSGTTMQMQKGQIVLTPYAVVEQLLAMGHVELI